MTLVITSNGITPNFVRWLSKQISQEIIIESNLPQIKLLTELVNSDKLFPFEKTSIDLRKAVIYAARNLRIDKSKHEWKISLDNNINYPRTSIKLVTLCKIVDNGCLGVRGTNLFTKEFKRVSASLTKYYNMYRAVI